MFKVKPLSVDGCYLLTPTVLMESSCDFIKVFNETQFNIYGLSTKFQEEYYAIAKPGVLRGLHYQAKPQGHDKIVSCILGSIIDVVVDMREESKTYGKYVVTELNDENRNLLYIPEGCAHGYYVSGDKDSLISYKVTKPFDKKYRVGIHWTSFDINWNLDCEPEISEEDSSLPVLR